MAITRARVPPVPAEDGVPPAFRQPAPPVRPRPLDDVTEDEVETRVTARTARQALLGRARPPRLLVLLEESVLLDVEQGVADRANGLVLLVDTAHEPSDILASHAGNPIARHRQRSGAAPAVEVRYPTIARWLKCNQQPPGWRPSYSFIEPAANCARFSG